MASSLCRNLSRARALAFYSTLSSSSSSSSSSFKTFRSAKSAILSEPDPEKLADLFTHQTTNFSRIRRHRPLFQLSVRKLSRSNRPDLVRQVLTSQIDPSLSNLSSEGFWIRHITLYSNNDMLDDAIQTFYQMKDSPCQQTEKSLSAVLTGFINHGLFDKVDDFMKDALGKTDVKPGIKSLNLVLKAFCMEGSNKGVEEIRNWVKNMEATYNVSPDINSFNVLLGACLKNKDWHGHGNVFDETVKEISTRGLEYNLTTYNYRIMKFCKNKECARAKKLLDEMVSKGLKPSAASYDTIIHGYCKVGDFEAARKVLDSMLVDGHVLPASNTYHTLVKHMVEEAEFDSALEMCKEIIKRKWIPPFEPMKELVEGLVKMSKAAEAKDMVEKVKKRLKGPALSSWGRIEAALPL